MKKTRLLNTYINNITMDEAVDFLLQKIRKRDSAYVMEINVDVVVKMEHDPELRHISDDADLTLVDGQPLLWIARWYGHPPENEGVRIRPCAGTVKECSKRGAFGFCVRRQGGCSSQSSRKHPDRLSQFGGSRRTLAQYGIRE